MCKRKHIVTVCICRNAKNLNWLVIVKGSTSPKAPMLRSPKIFHIMWLWTMERNYHRSCLYWQINGRAAHTLRVSSSAMRSSFLRMTSDPGPPNFQRSSWYCWWLKILHHLRCIDNKNKLIYRWTTVLKSLTWKYADGTSINCSNPERNQPMATQPLFNTPWKSCPFSNLWLGVTDLETVLLAVCKQDNPHFSKSPGNKQVCRAVQEHFEEIIANKSRTLNFNNLKNPSLPWKNSVKLLKQNIPNSSVILPSHDVTTNSSTPPVTPLLSWASVF